MIVWKKRIYILIIKLNGLFSFFVMVFPKRNKKTCSLWKQLPLMWPLSNSRSLIVLFKKQKTSTVLCFYWVIETQYCTCFLLFKQYIYIISYKVRHTDFYSRVAKLWKTKEWVSQVLQRVNKNPYKALSML